jgi:hypothetical protein
MKIITLCFCFLFLISCANSKDISFTASTPADPLVRTFLGISLADSIDFIRWNLSLTDREYKLQCNYGISKPNTNGFINGGEKLSLTGSVKFENNIYTLQNGNQLLKFSILNSNLLHIMNVNGNLLIGNGGWSYVLNNLTPVANDKASFTTTVFIIKDSVSFEGRTPCGVPGIIEPGKQCYKLKWGLKLYAEGNETGRFLLRGTPWYEQGGRKGNWKTIKGKDGRIIYQLMDEKGNAFINLLKLDDGVMIFTDTKGNLLVGDHDFSYMLNRKE